MTERRKPDRQQRPLSEEERIDESSRESFPASDPPSFTPSEPGKPADGKRKPPRREDEGGR